MVIHTLDGERHPISMTIPLLLGSMLAAVFILAAAFSISLFKPLARCLELVPLWALLCGIAVYIFVSGLVGW